MINSPLEHRSALSHGKPALFGAVHFRCLAFLHLSLPGMVVAVVGTHVIPVAQPILHELDLLALCHSDLHAQFDKFFMVCMFNAFR